MQDLACLFCQMCRFDPSLSAFLPVELAPPEHVTGKVAGGVGTKSALSRHQVDTLRKCSKESALLDLMAATATSDRSKFGNQVLNPLIEDGLVRMTIPEKPRSSKQKYRLTEKGRRFLTELEGSGEGSSQ